MFLNTSTRDTINEYVSTYGNKMPEFITFHHLTRRISNPKNKDTMDLLELLSSINEFSAFLNNYGLTFCLKKNRVLEVEFENRDLKIILEDNKDKDGSDRLKLRLFESDNCNDSCINGFLLGWDFLKNDNTNHYKDDLYIAPEIIQDLGNLLENNMKYDYMNQSNYYIISFKVNVEDCFEMDQKNKIYGDISKILKNKDIEKNIKVAFKTGKCIPKENIISIKLLDIRESALKVIEEW